MAAQPMASLASCLSNVRIETIASSPWHHSIIIWFTRQYILVSVYEIFFGLPPVIKVWILYIFTRKHLASSR